MHSKIKWRHCMVDKANFPTEEQNKKGKSFRKYMQANDNDFYSRVLIRKITPQRQCGLGPGSKEGENVNCKVHN